MDVKSITVNAVEMLAARNMQGAGFPAASQVQVQVQNSDAFGPEYEVNISREGRKLSRQQTTQAEKNVQSAQDTAAESNPVRLQEERKGLRETLTDMYRNNGFTDEELLERVNNTYQEICRRAQGGIQFSQNKPSEEAMAAMKELAQKAVKLEDITIDPSRARDLIQEAKAAGTYQEYKA